MIIVDSKSPSSEPVLQSLLQLESNTVASTLNRKLSVELPTPRHIYTVGTAVSGIIQLGTKDRDTIQEVQVSLVCVVRSMHHRAYSVDVRDFRRETNTLLHEDQTLWTRKAGDPNDPPGQFAFQLTVPEFGNDVKGKNPEVPLPPSFYAGRHSGWKKMLTYGTPIGYIKYFVKASVVRNGNFHRKERAYCPFVFLPPSSPPPLLPRLPNVVSILDLDSRSDVWDRDNARATLRHGIFSSNGQVTLTLWLPRVDSFPRLMRIPFILCLAHQTRRARDMSTTQPPSDILPPPAQLGKASLHLRLKIRSCARRGVQCHTRLLDENATDNFLHGVTPHEGSWALRTEHADAWWEKECIWCGLWTIREAPNFANRQLTWTYALVAEVPIKGLGNGVKLRSRNLEVNSGIIKGTNITTTSQENVLDLPPDYFDTEPSNEEEDEDHQ